MSSERSVTHVSGRSRLRGVHRRRISLSLPYFRVRPSRSSVRAVRTSCTGKTNDQSTPHTFPRARLRELFPAKHTSVRGVPFGSDQPPKENGQADGRESGDREKKNDDWHTVAGRTAKHYYRARNRQEDGRDPQGPPG